MLKMSNEEDRSDTESPVGPVREPDEPLHGYVNLPQNLKDQSEEMNEHESVVPPPLAKKERSR